MAKQTLIFDASVIAGNLKAGRGRSGIYFASYNILRGLIESDAFDISLYTNFVDDNVVEFCKQNFGADIKIYCNNKFIKILSRLSQLDVRLRKNRHNITKLLLNLFVRKPIKLFGQCIKLPKFDVAISPIYVFSRKIHADHKYIVLYDAIPLLFSQYYKTARSNQHYWFDVLVQYIKTKPDCKYFAISQSCKNDFVRLLDMNPNDITVIPLAANDNFYCEKDDKKIMAVRAKYNIPDNKKYVFSLCTLEPRKNLICAVKTFVEFIKKNNIDDLVFVLGGGHWDEFFEKLKSEIEDLGQYKDKIIRAGYVDDADLAALYSGAEWFVYTSQYEGFGLPPLEAMKCGCPVITSNNSSLPEVIGDAGIMIDWDNDAQHIAAYEKYYFDKDYRDKMAMAGLKHSKEFSWNKTVKIITKTIQENN